MGTFTRVSDLPDPPAELYSWHARPGALTRLTPPWQRLERVGGEEPLAEGQTVRLRLGVGPLRLPWTALHRDLVPGSQFLDEMRSGPFARWVHLHRFEPAGQGSRVRDEIEYSLPGGGLVERLGGPLLQAMLGRAFRYRHQILRSDLERHRPWRDRPRLRVAVTGATGLVGRQLCAFLTTGGHQVFRMTRRPVPGQPDIGWDPGRGALDADLLEGMDAVVHLAGESIAGRWTPARKQEILRSRTEGTLLLARALAALKRPPRVLVSSSAIGFYGDRGEEPVSEESSSGKGFLAQVCREWEAATAPAAQAGIRVVQVRTGLVLTPQGGSLAAMLPPFYLGLGGPVGTGRQYWSWIALDDLLGVMHHALWDEGLAGPVNAVAGSCRNRAFARTLGRALRRPALVPLPVVAVRALLGQMGEELLLAGAQVLPARLGQRDFRFHYPELPLALGHVLGVAQR